MVYCYVLAPSSVGGLLGLSDLLCGMTGMRIGTVLPVNFTLSLKQSPTATMTWSAPVGGVDAYLLQVIPLNGTPVSTVPLGGGVTTFTSAALPAAGSCFQLIAFKASEFGTTNVLCGVPGISSIPDGGPASLKAAHQALQAVGGTMAAAGAGFRWGEER